MIKIIFLDFDETLYSHTTNCIPESAAKALNTLHDKGIKIYLCTGRAKYEMNNFDTSNVIIDGMVGNNGLLVYGENNEVIYKNPLKDELLDIVVTKFKQKETPMLLCSDDYIFANFLNYKMIKVEQDLGSAIPMIKEYEGENIYLCSALEDQKQNWKDNEKLSKIARVTYWHDEAIDIMPIDASKATGISKVLEYYGFDASEAMAIGDGNNDIEMLEYCGIGVAMDNSPNETKKVADYVTTGVDNDGIYNALKYYKLIK